MVVLHILQEPSNHLKLLRMILFLGLYRAPHLFMETAIYDRKPGNFNYFAKASQSKALAGGATLQGECCDVGYLSPTS